MYPRWLDGFLGWRDLFVAHNEHRIALTRLADLALFIACGGWNLWVQLLFNAVLHAATAGLLAALFWPAQPGRERASSLIVIAVVFASTAGWQNALWGFQSPVYFNNLLQLVREYPRPGRPRVFRRDPRLPGPHPAASAVMRVIDDPSLRRVLPVQLLDATDPRGGRPAVVRHAPLPTAFAGLLLTAAIAVQATRLDPPTLQRFQKNVAGLAHFHPPSALPCLCLFAPFCGHSSV